MDFAGQKKGAGRPRFLWAGRMVLSLVFFGASGAKLLGAPQIVDLFAQIGFGQWFRYLTAALEAAGALLLLIPARGLVGAALLSAVMLGAVITNIALGLSPVGAIVLLLALIVIGWALNRARKETQ